MEGDIPKTPEMQRRQPTSTPTRGNLAPPFVAPEAEAEAKAREEPPTEPMAELIITAPPASGNQSLPASVEQDPPAPATSNAGEAKKTPARKSHAANEPPTESDGAGRAPLPDEERRQRDRESPSQRKGASRANKVKRKKAIQTPMRSGLRKRKNKMAQLTPSFCLVPSRTSRKREKERRGRKSQRRRRGRTHRRRRTPGGQRKNRNRRQEQKASGRENHNRRQEQKATERRRTSRRRRARRCRRRRSRGSGKRGVSQNARRRGRRTKSHGNGAGSGETIMVARREEITMSAGERSGDRRNRRRRPNARSPTLWKRQEGRARRWRR